LKKSGIRLAVIPAMLWSALSVADGSSNTKCVEYGYAGSETILKCTPSPSAQRTNSSEEYWTDERIKKAKPYPVSKAKGVDSLRALSRLDESVRESGFDQGSFPTELPAPQPDSGDTPKSSVDSSSRLQTGLTQKMAAVSMATQQVGLPVHSTFSVPRVLYAPPTPLYPYIAIGKVFFTSQVDGKDYQCSGSSIGGRAVLTAGHCVVDQGKAHTNWVFMPIYYNGERPYGTWTQQNAFIFKSWAEQENLGRDVAFSIVADQQGSMLSAKVGALGFAWNYPRQRLWAMFGYPAAPPYAGFEMIETLAPTAFIQDEVDGQKADPPTTGAGSLQTAGSSGGPWITDFSPGLVVSNFANGVNSYGYVGLDAMFSPYFDDSVKAMKDAAVAQ
jgi:hypothetical protein